MSEAENITELRTERLVLRRPQMSDVEPITELIGNWDVIRWLSMPPYPYKREDAEGFVERVLAEGESVDCCKRTITRDGAAIGNIGFGPRGKDGMIRIGYWLGEPYWGKGYMSEALAAMLAHFFATTDEDEMASGVYEGNGASLRIQEKLGFEVVGQTEQFCVPRGETVTLIETRLPRARYEARQR